MFRVVMGLCRIVFWRPESLRAEGVQDIRKSRKHRPFPAVSFVPANLWLCQDYFELYYNGKTAIRELDCNSFCMGNAKQGCIDCGHRAHFAYGNGEGDKRQEETDGRGKRLRQSGG